MIRPSSLKIGRYCSLAPVLSEQFPDRSEAASYGSEVDRIVTAALNHKDVQSTDPEAVNDAAACLAWIGRELHDQQWIVTCQEVVHLYDPDTGALVTKGTADIVARRGEELIIVDLKKREQYWAGRLGEIDPDLQTHAYALGAAQKSGSARYRKAFLLFGGGEVEAQWSEWYFEARWPEIMDEIMGIELRPVKPTRGTHCLSCYPRQHCPAWLLPEGGIEGALEPLSKPGGLTIDNAPAALELYKRAEDLLEKVGEQLRDYARKEGGIVVGDRRWAAVLMSGRKSANVAALEAAGLGEYVREGGRFEQFRFLKAK